MYSQSAEKIHKIHGSADELAHAKDILKNLGHDVHLVGPTNMVNGVHKMLNKAGINDDDIRRDEFEGY